MPAWPEQKEVGPSKVGAKESDNSADGDKGSLDPLLNPSTDALPQSATKARDTRMNRSGVQSSQMENSDLEMQK